VIKKTELFWNELPKEVKVGTYLIGAYILSDLVAPFFGGVDNRIAFMISNLALVLAVEMRKRYEAK